MKPIRWTESAIIEALRAWVDRYGEVPARVDWDRSMCRRRSHTAKLARLDSHPDPLPSPVPVLARFGSWEAALAAAGFRARFVPRRVSAQALSHTIALYDSGLALREVADRLGLDPKTVRERLDRAGLPRRASRRQRVDEYQAAILAAAREGASVRELAQRFDVAPHLVRGLMEQHDAAGARLIRRIRAELTNSEPALTERQRDIVALVVVQRLPQGHAAQLLGIAPSTVTKDLKAVADKLQRA